MGVIVEGKKYEISGLKAKSFDEPGGLTFDGEKYPKSLYSRGNVGIDFIVLHWTGGESSNARRVRDTLQDRSAGAHFFIAIDGTVHQFMDTKFAGVHAKFSKNSIGIEIQNPGKPGIATPKPQRETYQATILGEKRTFYTFTDEQIKAAKKLSRFLCDQYNLSYQVPSNEDGSLYTNILPTDQAKAWKGILGHFHVSDDGKLDPGADLLNSILQDVPPTNESKVVPYSPEHVEVHARRRPIKKKKKDKVIERLESMTTGNKSPFGGKAKDYAFTYGVISGSGEFEPYKVGEVPANDDLVASSTNRFVGQLNALKKVSTLDLAQAVPVLEIYAYGEDGNMVNLNEKIFSKPTFHNMFESVDVNVTNKERPIASLVSFRETIDEPAKGGAYGISKAQLMLKINNASAVNVNHPTGKYISYMLDYGLPIRIRFGTRHPRKDKILDEAFQWAEKDFHITHHQATINNDLTINATFFMTTTVQKIMNFFHVGQALPISEINESDIKIASDNQKTVKDLKSVFNLNNSDKKYAGVGVYQNPDGTLESTLRGALPGLLQIFSEDKIEPIRIENAVNALQTIQANLLTKKYDQILSVHAYQYEKKKDVVYPAVNVGPLFETMLKDDLEGILRQVTSKNVNIGDRYSTEILSKSSTKVKFIFGNFNQDAGVFWGGKPISAFPINIEALFAFIREERKVGGFSGKINQFIRKIASIIADETNFTPIKTEKVVNGKKVKNVSTLPEIKYTWYKSKKGDASWIFYVFDAKEKAVNMDKFLDQASKTDKSKIKSFLVQKNAPFIEPGSEQSLIRNMTAETINTDNIGGNAFFKANLQNYTERQLDAAANLPSGISSEFFAGFEIDPGNISRREEAIIPLQMTIDHYNIITAEMFGHMYVFNPILRYSRLYQILQVAHVIENGKASTELKLLVTS